MAITLHTDTQEKLPEQTELAADSRIRDDFQKQIDRDVETLKTATAKAAWPEHVPAKLYHRYVVGGDDRGALKSVIRRAAILHRVEAVFYRDAKTEAGHYAVKFHVVRKLGKDGKPVEDATLNTDGSPKAAEKK